MLFILFILIIPFIIMGLFIMAYEAVAILALLGSLVWWAADSLVGVIQRRNPEAAARFKAERSQNRVPGMKLLRAEKAVLIGLAASLVLAGSLTIVALTSGPSPTTTAGAAKPATTTTAPVMPTTTKIHGMPDITVCTDAQVAEYNANQRADAASGGYPYVVDHLGSDQTILLSPIGAPTVWCATTPAQSAASPPLPS